MPSSRKQTFCVVVEKTLAVASCPLPQGRCVWKHRVTGICTYDPKADTNTIEQIAHRVGAPVPSESEYVAIKNQLFHAIKKELTQ